MVRRAKTSTLALIFEDSPGKRSPISEQPVEAPTSGSPIVKTSSLALIFEDSPGMPGSARRFRNNPSRLEGCVFKLNTLYSD